MIKIPITLQIAILTVALTGFYMMVGQAVPQKEVHPPEVIEISKDLSSEAMVELGKEIFEGKGICSTCHTIGKSGALRFPDLAGIGTRAASQLDGYSAVDYLAESLYEPGAHIVEGFNPGMPAADKPPIGLTDDEILTVIAYLQSLGAQPTVTMETKLAYTGGAAPGEEAVIAEEAEEGAGEAGEAAGETQPSALATYDCTSCHYVDQPGELEAVSLYDVGQRLSREQLLSETIYHEGEPVLGQVSQDELQKIIDQMSELKGEG